MSTRLVYVPDAAAPCAQASFPDGTVSQRTLIRRGRRTINSIVPLGTS